MSFTRKQERALPFLRGIVYGNTMDNKDLEDLISRETRLTIHDCNVLLHITNARLLAVKKDKDSNSIAPLRACVEKIVVIREELTKKDRDRYSQLSTWSRLFDCCRHNADDQIRDVYEDLVDRANRSYEMK